jgi:protoheme IX farnesyltransferase
MMLAVFTALVGLSIAPVRLDPLGTFAAVLAIAAGAGAAGVLNMWYDADIDAIMPRTAMRPIPRARSPGSRPCSLDSFLAVSQ